VGGIGKEPLNLSGFVVIYLKNSRKGVCEKKVNNVLIDIIIINYNSTDYLLKCLQSVFDDLGGRSANVFVQDNGSKDGINRIRRHFPQVMVHENKKI
jgi:hypothetical protein